MFKGKDQFARNFIKQQMIYSISGDEIIDSLNKQVILIKYSDLHLYNSLEEILNISTRIIILLEEEPNVGHYICIVLNQNVLNYFDSYGLYIFDQMRYTMYPNDNILDIYIKQYMTNNRHIKLDVNFYRLQSNSRKSSVCGRYITLRCLMDKLNNNEFINTISLNGYNHDEVVTMYTLASFPESFSNISRVKDEN